MNVSSTGGGGGGGTVPDGQAEARMILYATILSGLYMVVPVIYVLVAYTNNRLLFRSMSRMYDFVKLKRIGVHATGEDRLRLTVFGREYEMTGIDTNLFRPSSLEADGGRPFRRFLGCGPVMECCSCDCSQLLCCCRCDSTDSDDHLPLKSAAAAAAAAAPEESDLMSMDYDQSRFPRPFVSANLCCFQYAGTVQSTLKMIFATSLSMSWILFYSTTFLQSYTFESNDGCPAGFSDCYVLRFGSRYGMDHPLDCAHPEEWSASITDTKTCFRMPILTARLVLANAASTAAFLSLVLGSMTAIFARMIHYSDHPQLWEWVWTVAGFGVGCVMVSLPFLNIIHTPLAQTISVGSCLSVYGIAKLHRYHRLAVEKDEFLARRDDRIRARQTPVHSAPAASSSSSDDGSTVSRRIVASDGALVVSPRHNNASATPAPGIHMDHKH